MTAPTIDEAREYDRRSWEMVLAGIESLAAYLADFPQVWGWGDGDGGCVLDELRNLLLANGVIAPPRPRDLSRPRNIPITAATRYRIMERDGFLCLVCGVRKDLTVDHIQPRVSGGGNEDENLQTLCRSCNSSKGTQTIDYRV